MSNTMDNCCVCASGGRKHAAVLATFHWPGFAPFTTTGRGSDTLGVRYLTATVTILNAAGTAITKTLTSNSLNGSFTDTVTGTDATGDGPWVSFGLYTPPWSDAIIDPGGTLVTWPDAGSKIQLSNPIFPADCLTAAQNLLASIALGGLTLGTDSKDVTYDPIWSGGGANPWQRGSNTYSSGSDSWPALGVFPGPETPPGSGNFKPQYGWGDELTGALYTVSGVTGPAAFNAFESVTPFMNSYADSGDFPPTPGSMSYYNQENFWQLRKSISDTVSAPVCCEDDSYGFASAPSPLCQMITDDHAGHLILNPPALTFLQTDHYRSIVRTPVFGTALTGGGCPCA